MSDHSAEDEPGFLMSILENVPHMVFVKRASDLRFVLFNKAGQDLLGLTHDELMGKTDFDVFPAEQAEFFVRKDREVLNDTKMLLIPEEPIASPGGVRLLRTKKITLLNAAGEPAYLVGISEDITDWKRDQDLIEEQRQALVLSSKFSALGEMAAGIAHEINNPLAIITGWAEALQQLAAIGRLDAASAEPYTERIIATTKRIAKIIQGLKVFSSADPASAPELTSAQAIIDSTLTFCSERFRSHGVALDVVVPEEPVMLLARPVQLSQVLLNLLNNAFDAVAAQAVQRITVTLHHDEQSVTLSVQDTGVGVAAEKLEKIFEPFFSTKPVGKGTGLGLSISKGIVEQHQGSITCQTPAAGGAVFTLKLPKRLQTKKAAL